MMPYTPALLTEMANTSSRARRRAEAMGFVFGRATVEHHRFSNGNWQVDGTFTCVCGKEEYYRFIIPDMEVEALGREAVDPAERLWRFGSFSAAHLREDGYTEDQIAEMFDRLREFDERNSQRPSK